MRKLKALLYKDYLLLIRDKSGLALMFLMPLVLVILMAYLQDSTFSSITESKVPLILLNVDKDSLGDSVEEQMTSSGIFQVSTQIGKDSLTESELEKAVALGKYQIGIVIPANTTKIIRNNVRKSVIQSFNGISEPIALDSLFITVYIDPTTKNSFKSTLMSSMREYAANLQTEFILAEIKKEVNRLVPIPIGDIQIAGNPVQIREQYAKLDNSRIIPNSVQHNVPAWGMFAVFFIVVSLSGNIIKEREDVSTTRLLTMPCPYWLYLFSKIIIYLIVCLLQFTLMFAVGVFLFPALGLPSLSLGNNWIALILVSLSASLAAIGYGIAIGKVATSNQQAAIFGSISVVILAAIGGVWIPTFVMPQAMRVISNISPLSWGMNGFYDIFVRGEKWSAVLPECAALIAFFILCGTFAILYDKRKRIDI